MKRLVLCLAALVALAQPAYATPEGAKNFVDSVAKDVMAIVRNESATRPQKQARLESLFVNKVDINFVARFVLGKHWRTATPKQQMDYIAAYRPFILKNYASRLAKYSGQTYALKNARVDSDADVVTMEIIDPSGQNILVDYRLKASGGGYKIIDIMVEGVSLLTTQRSEFNGIVENKGIDGLIEALKKQVAAQG
jgi:phospholipid transport system substrate-binding protein